MPAPHVDPTFLAQVKGWRLVTADIAYHMPDRPVLLQNFIWQEYDDVTRLIVLKRFLRFWEEKLDGPVHSVLIVCSGVIAPTRMQFRKGELTLN
jgi:uncharacterized protein Usg